uniref:At1g61320/AtMIF1 LRR domain-containing protein n=1 Tax=Oryza rufipogon TaxID=4529 RepID=A0A0E0N8L2_ORYRU
MSSVAVQREQRWQNLALAPALPMSKPQLPLPPSPVSDKSNCTVGSTNNSPSEQVGHGDSLIYSLPYLPEDIWRHIHSLMPMSAAARAACLSHSFLNSWRFHPNLSLNFKTLCPRTSRGNFKCKIDSILRNHLGTAKILKLNVADEDSTYPYIDRWLEGLKSSLLRYIKSDELESLLLNSLVLEQLRLNVCNKISFLKIPCVLQHLSCLSVMACRRMQVIVCEAPNLSSISLSGGIKFSLGETLTMKVLSMIRPNVVCYARAQLPSIMPNLESMVLSSDSEAVNIPMLPTKFLCLKHLTIQIARGTFSPSYDYFFLVSFLHASPSLETLYLDEDMRHESIVEDSSAHLRQLPELSHECLKSVEIIGFNSAKSLVELTCCIVKAAASLERLVLDTLRGGDRCSGESNGKICWPVSNAVLKESARAAIAVRKVSSSQLGVMSSLVCQDDMAHESIIESSSPHLRQLPELSHDCLKSVKILGFNSAKSLVELTCGIVKAAVSLERLVLDTLRGGDDRCCGESNGKICWPVSNAVLKESARAAIAVRRYIEDKVSPITTLTLVEPCTRFKRHGGEEAMGLGGGRNRKEGGWVREGDVEETWGWMGMVQSAMVAQAKAETRSSGRTSLEQSGETTGWVTKVLELGIDWGGRSQAFILQELSVLDVAGNAEAWQHAARLDASVEKHHANMHTIW